MEILLIDSSSKKIEFGYADNSGLIFRKELEPEFNADTLTYFIRDTFQKNKADIRDIDYVGLSNGPGSFTGLRIGSAIAKGICFSSGSKLIEIPTLDLIANKLVQKFSGTTEFTDKKITSLIFSNTRTGEFYNCRYNYVSSNLDRISEYSADLPDNLFKCEGYFVINEKMNDNIDTKFLKKLTDVSELSNLDSLFDLTIDRIKKNNISDYKTSEPFYMKEFFPNI